MPIILATQEDPSDQKDFSSKSAQANSPCDPILKKPITKKRAGGVAQGVGHEFKPQY
jgi:hypothetical protein